MNRFDPADPYLDREKHISVTETGHLPHWNQGGKIQFVTFRLADSLPQSKLRELKVISDQFIANNPQPWDIATTQRYHRQLGRVTEEQLHAGAGSCMLRAPELRDIVADAIHYHDGEDYCLLGYVIMPNHVHLLLHLPPDGVLGPIMNTIKRFTANSINRALSRRGVVWQRENHDRLIRNRIHLDNCISYIRHNPDHLPPSHYTLYISPLWTTY